METERGALSFLRNAKRNITEKPGGPTE